MYYIIYGLLYLMSLLPFWLLYPLSDFVAFLLYNVSGYRKKIVLNNLSIAFPEKTLKEKKIIAKKFYRNLTDTFLETIKMISMSDKEFEKRCTIDIADVNKLAATGISIQLHSGHQMNWEYMNWILAKNLTIRWVGIYQPIGNKALNKIFYQLRARYNTVLVSTKEFRTRMHQLFKNQYALGLAADQNIAPDRAYWQYFFSKPVPFVMGPEKGAIRNKTAVVFFNSIKGKKRGYYHFQTTVVTTSAEGMEKGELTRLYRDFLEDVITKKPENYLWTHRRWRHNYEPQYQKNWIDTRPPNS
jgi:Kdo2-lipid IVA lauroyltransferase/acyltransferase